MIEQSDTDAGTPGAATTLRIALPNKGRLSDRALALFEKGGLRAEYRPERALMTSMGSGFQALFVRASDVPEFVADGAADVGVSGADLLAESGRPAQELLDLEFGRCRLVVAVREDSPLKELGALPSGTRVATSFPNATTEYFQRLGIDVQIAPVSGATEIAPYLGVAEVIADLTSTGTTLKVNGLREIGTILHSTARLVANTSAWQDPEKRPAIEELVAALGSVLCAKDKRYLMANVPRDSLHRVRKVLPGISGPTVVEVLDGNGWVAAHAVVEADRIYQTISRLKALGAEGILVTPIERLMP